MFYYIEGKLAHLDYSFAVIDAHGVGYKMTITQTTYESMPPHLSVAEAPTVRLYTYMAVREDDVELFGFISQEELAAFKMLITVSGVGPKAAISILSQLSPSKLAVAICTDDKKAIRNIECQVILEVCIFIRSCIYQRLIISVLWIRLHLAGYCHKSQS